MEGGTCMYTNDCQKGFSCIRLTPFQCRPLCRLGTTCDGGMACNPFGNIPDAGFCRP